MKKSKKKTIILEILAILFIIVGIGVIVYPKITNLLYKEEVKTLKDDFFNNISELNNKVDEDDEGKKLIDELYKELCRRNEELFLNNQKDLKDPFSYEQPTINLNDYGLEGNIIGFLTIPRINIELPILLGANKENMKQGAVHLTETSYPVGGNNTNCVLAAHRGYQRTDMFKNIDDLQIGDEVYIRNFRETLTYKVVETKVITPTQVDKLLIQKGRDLVTLISCHPYTKNYQRYVVYCERN